MTETLAPPPARQSEHPIDQDILARWSPRAFDGSALDAETLHAVIEAARWAPSAYNYQPWRFVYELRDGPRWEEFVSILLPFNQAWAKDASALLFVLSDRLITPPGSTESAPATTASFDSGAAWGLLALQAAKLGLHSHAMAGFDHESADSKLGTAGRYKVEAAVAIGRLGNPESLPEALQAREFPSQRLPIEEIAYRGRLP